MYSTEILQILLLGFRYTPSTVNLRGGNNQLYEKLGCI